MLEGILFRAIAVFLVLAALYALYVLVHAPVDVIP